MGANSPLFYEDPVQLASGDGVWLTDVDGQRYLDLYNNVPCVGHANPRVAQAIADQMSTLNVHSRYLHANVVDYLERLLGLHHDGIESAIMACSGTEATELAITMARHATGNQGIICTDATYHGNSAVMSQLSWLPVGHSQGNVRSIATPQLFRPLDAELDEAALLERHLDQLRDTIAGFEADGVGFAGMMICTILANEGLPTVPAGWYQAATDMVRDAGGMVIGDEVQAGFARSGRWWGYEKNDFVPDIVCMGKPMGNGMPVSAVAASHDMVSSFRARARYFNTFASSPVQAAAGMAVLDEITDRQLVDNAALTGASLLASLRARQAANPRMGDVRGQGLFIGIDWVHPETTDPDLEGAAAMVESLKRNGVLLGKAGQHKNVLKIRPPLVFGPDEADVFLTAFDQALADANH